MEVEASVYRLFETRAAEAEQVLVRLRWPSRQGIRATVLKRGKTLWVSQGPA